MKPYSESCEQNREPILQVLRAELSKHTRLLEIGSGTGQHAVYFASEFPAMKWQTSDVATYHVGIHAWIDDSEADNILPPITLDVHCDPWPNTSFDAVFSANTVHIMAWPEVKSLFEGIGKVLEAGGLFLLYGPFNYNGRFTSESNARFEKWLQARDPESGGMPSNNRILVWMKMPVNNH